MVVKKKSERWREDERGADEKESLRGRVSSLSYSSVASHHHVSLLPDFTFYYSFCYQSLSFLCFAAPYRSATPSYLCVARPV